MSQRFIRCSHCGMPHDVSVGVCPVTGKAMVKLRNSNPSPPGDSVAPPPAPAAAGKPIKGTIMQKPLAVNVAPPAKKTRDLLGKTVNDKYRVTSVLGEGGMGAVFEAEQLAFGRAVAMKVLHPAEAKKKEAVKRFHQEARAAGSIGHPNICEVYDFGTLDDGSPYLVMEKLVGQTLADRIHEEGGLPFNDVVEVLAQVLSGLTAAHEKGVVHRDIKPENVFLTKRPGVPSVAKILDFGVSKMIHPVLSGDREEDLDLTRTGMVMGTPYYMAPEQARGDRNLDARVDLWACGVMLYEALTGRRPFMAANYNALLLQILTTNPRPAREFRPAIPQAFDAVLDRAMARSREDRFPSADHFRRELLGLKDRHHVPPERRGNAGNMDVTAVRTPMAKQKRGLASPSRKRAPTAPEGAVSIEEVPTTIDRPTAVESRKTEVEPPFTDDDPPSSLDIPVTFADEAPPSDVMIPVHEASRAEHLPVADKPVPSSQRGAPSSARDGRRHRARHVGDEDTRVSPLPVPHDVADGETTERRGSEMDLAIADARRALARDTFPRRPSAHHDAPAKAVGSSRTPSIPAPAPAPAPPPPPTGRPGATPKSGGWSSVPAPPPPPRPPRKESTAAAAPDDDDDDELYTRVMVGRIGDGRPSAPAPSPEDTLKMEDNLEERLREAKERISQLPPSSHGVPPTNGPPRRRPRR